MNRKQLALIAAACGAVVLLGVILPWVTVGSGEHSKSYNGFESEADFTGTPVFIIGILAGVAALLVFLGKTDVIPIDARQHLFVSMALYALALILLLTDFFGDVFDKFGQGFGLILAVIGAAGGIVTAFLATTKPASE